MMTPEAIFALLFLIGIVVAVVLWCVFMFFVFRWMAKWIRYYNRTILNSMKLINEEAKRQGIDDPNPKSWLPPKG